MNPIRDLPATAELVVEILESLKIPYAVGGALAQNYWGTVRATQDLDVLISLPRIRFAALAEVLAAHGFSMRDVDGKSAPVTVEAVVREDQDRHHFAVYMGLVKVELFLPFLPLQHAILRRAVRAPLGNREASITTAEDLILLKMAFHREKDILDVRAMIWGQKDRLDLAYLREWAGRMLEDSVQRELEDLIRTHTA